MKKSSYKIFFELVDSYFRDGNVSLSRRNYVEFILTSMRMADEYIVFDEEKNGKKS